MTTPEAWNLKLALVEAEAAFKRVGERLLDMRDRPDASAVVAVARRAADRAMDNVIATFKAGDLAAFRKALVGLETAVGEAILGAAPHLGN